MKYPFESTIHESNVRFVLTVDRFQGFTRHYVARSKFFQGVPAPAGGYLALLPVILEFNGQRMPDMQQYLGPLFDGRVTASAVMIIVAMLMVSALPMLSGKVFMRNPVKESHLRSRSLGTQIFKASFVVACIAMLVK
jgi:phosphatidylserine synthase